MKTFHGSAQDPRLNLMIALLHRNVKPGEHLTASEIAKWCGCSTPAIQQIEWAALEKVRKRLGRLLITSKHDY